MALPHQKDAAVVPHLGTLLDKIVQTLSISVSAVPVAGGPASGALGVWLETRRHERWVQYWDMIEERVQRLDMSKLDADYLGTDEFVHRLGMIHLEVTRSANDTKLEFLRDYLLGCIWQKQSDVHWRDLHWQHVVALSGAHLSMLEYFHQKQGHMSHAQRFTLPQPQQFCPLRVDALKEHFTTFDEQLIRILASDLVSHELLGLWSVKGDPKGGWSITDSGISLMNFLTTSWDLKNTGKAQQEHPELQNGPRGRGPF